MNDKDELSKWLNRNKSTLEKYDSDEVARMASLNGFEMGTICEVLSHWIVDRQSCSQYATREKWYVDRELDSINVLKESWQHLGRYLTLGREFDQ